MKETPEVRTTKAREAYHRRGWELRLKREYGLELGGYDALLEGQGGVCAICGNGSPNGWRLAVDHNHETGEVRGLLCVKCNRAVGLLNDDAERAHRLAAYLEN